MTDLQLEFDEGIILQSTEVERYAQKEYSLDEMILTNKNIICVYSKSTGLFSKQETIVEKIPLSAVKVASGNVQARMFDSEEYGMGLQIFFTNGQREHFVFYDEKCELPRWEKKLCSAVAESLTTSISSENNQVVKNNDELEEKTHDNSEKTLRFCSYCGTKLDTGAKFCKNCGEAVAGNTEDLNVPRKQNADVDKPPIVDGQSEETANSTKTTKEKSVKNNNGVFETPIEEQQPERKFVYEGEIHKCPNCGDIIDAYETTCEACGFEIRDRKASDSLRTFSQKLEDIEKKRNKEQKAKDDDDDISVVDEQKISLIKSFPIPNTKEDLLEFMILAASNINTTRIEGWDSISSADIAISDAWQAKFEQAYEKAKLAFEHTLEFKKIQAIYEKKSAQIKDSKKKRKIFWIGLISFPVIGIALLWGLVLGINSADSNKIQKENERLGQIVEEVYTAIENETFVLARTKVAQLVFSASTSTEGEQAAKKWDTLRYELLDAIDVAEGLEPQNRAQNAVKKTEEEKGVFDEVMEDIDEFLSGSSDENEKTEEKSVVKDTVKQNVTISKGTEFTYGDGEFDLYLAKAVSDKIIKIEKWGKKLSTSKTVEYEYDVGTFKINESENNFKWLDDKQTAFSFNLKDKSNWGLRKGKDVVFTPLIVENDTHKGTNYMKNKESYSYTNDDWHMYRAVPLTDKLIKIECWYRSMSIGSFSYGYDVFIFNPDDNKKDFEWSDEEHTSFTITIQDTENSDLKTPKFVTFERE